MIDVVSVVFREELSVLRLQARSVELYCQHIGIKNIYVIVNDDNSVAANIDPAWWGTLSSLVEIIPRSTFGNAWVQNGWVSQQVLKIYGAAQSANTWALILDAKSLLVKNIDLSDLMPQGQPMVGSLDVYPVFQRSQQIAENLFNIKLEKQLGPGGVPFLMHCETVRNMIAETQSLTSKNFAEWFQDQGMLTEFILYSAYLQHRYKSFETLYGKQSRLNNINVCHSEVEQFDKKFKSMKDSGVVAVSIHRNAWNKLSQLQRQEFKDFLVSRGIQ